MALTSPEDYVRLGKHLEEIDAIFQQFLRESGYSDNSGRLGRYPHRSAILYGRFCRKIDLQIEHNIDGQRFDEFFLDIPYRLWAGAWLDQEFTRFSWLSESGTTGIVIFEHFPFSKVKDILLDSLKLAARRLDAITESSLKEFGSQSTLQQL